MDLPIFKLGDFQVVLWHLIFLVGFLAVLAMVIILSIRVSKILKSRRAAQLAAEQRKRENAAAQKKAAARAAKSKAQTASTVSSQPAPTPVPAPAPAPVQTQPVAPVQEQETGEQKVYTVRYRSKDKHWLVLVDKNTRPLKLFETQEEALAFAEGLIKHKDAQIKVYRMDGQLHSTIL